MLTKRPGEERRERLSKLSKVSRLWRTGRWLVAGELVFLTTTFFIWHRLNVDQSFRLYAHKNYNWVLEKYYEGGEFLSKDFKIREADIAAWKRQGKI